ncbi:hypothetical protein TKK_0006618 [Trichogramma kaykai]|uniref:NADH:ubiquinone oxidoreductase intermediate-associated protein 30 domain-containing protein n=1 Tax=Trichogramma kaykai TaxID=54128 RepID=A0ABD2XC17_9HYME
MLIYPILASLCIGGGLLIRPASCAKMMLFDFTKPDAAQLLQSWHESSDTVREVGQSKAALVLQRSQLFQRAVFFALLNPQPNGAGFAGVRSPVAWDLRGRRELCLRYRARGQIERYKLVLRHRGQHSNDDVEYEQIFRVRNEAESMGEFREARLALADFKPYWRGREQPQAPPLDLERVSMIGLQVFGGVYMDYKQSGVGSMEIDAIWADDSN